MASLLWVDDDLGQLTSQISQLRSVGYSVHGAESIAEGVEALRQQKFNAVLLDIMMPPGDLFSELETMGGTRTGIFFAQYVRLHFPDTPIFIYSITEPSTFDENFLFSNGIQFFRKQSYPGKAIIEMIRQMPEFEAKPNALDTVELKPGMFGLKVDLRKFIAYMKNHTK